MAIVAKQSAVVGVAPACAALGMPRATFYRRRTPKVVVPSTPRPASPRALPEGERRMVLSMLNDDRFAEQPPAQVYATLLDEGKFVCSISTMYRVLRENRQVRERRNQLRHPKHQAPELLATCPNELWSWDITKLKGPVKWTYFYLYVILDVFSRYVVGWMVAHRESAALAGKLIGTTCENQGITREQLTLHADRGSSMTSKPVALLLSDLGVVKSHSRPHVSNDNPYSESHFKTLKYSQEFPGRFGSIEDARSFLIDFFQWYNTMHHHGGLGLMTPYDIHHGLAAKRFMEREKVLRKAFEAAPERFVRGVPKPPAIPTEAWINKPKSKDGSSEVLHSNF
jgi:putative transposase